MGSTPFDGARAEKKPKKPILPWSKWIYVARRRHKNVHSRLFHKLTIRSKFCSWSRESSLFKLSTHTHKSSIWNFSSCTKMPPQASCHSVELCLHSDCNSFETLQLTPYFAKWKTKIKSLAVQWLKTDWLMCVCVWSSHLVLLQIGLWVRKFPRKISGNLSYFFPEISWTILQEISNHYKPSK